MIDISFLYSGLTPASAAHRYGAQSKNNPFSLASENGTAKGRRPIVVWNITRTCNLNCVHCYSDSGNKRYRDELNTEEAIRLIDDLAAYRVPVILFSGGEPLLRADLFDLAAYAKKKGVRTVLSSNGTLISEQIARQIKSTAFSYAGVSLDGTEEVHDRFRGLRGTFVKTMKGIRNLISVGQKTGLRLTLTQHTIGEIDSIFELIVREKINRVCFYHLVPSGRGKSVTLAAPETIRAAIDKIIRKTEETIQSGFPLEVLTVDNHCDGTYLYMKLKEKNKARAEEARRYLAWNGGGRYSSGTAIAAIDFEGNVHADQFWQHYSLGNVKEKKFSEIWSNSKEPLLEKLRDSKNRIHGRCASCRYFDICGGGLRVRAELITGDTWASDPACYLIDREIASA
jgi:radical SAM protein with 4Fe4S-binding SPASM domain